MDSLGYSASYLLSPLVAATLTVVLAGLVVQAGLREHNRRVFLLVLLSLVLWALFTFAMRNSRTVEAALLWERWLAVCMLALFVTYFHFCHVYVDGRRRWPIALLYILAAPAAAIVLFTNLAVEGMSRTQHGWFPKVGPTGTIIFGAVYVLMVVNVIRLLRARRRFAAADRRKRFLTLAVAGLLPLFGMLADGFTELPPVGIWTHLAFCTVCTFAILRYRLFDLRVAARKGLINLLVGTLIAAPFVGAVVLANSLLADRTSLVWIYIGAMVVFALLLWPAYEWARRRVDRLFFSERYDLLELVRGLSRNVDARTGFEEVGAQLTEIVGRALRASSTSLLQPDTAAQDLCLVSRDGRSSRVPKPILAAGSPVVRWLQEQRAALPIKQLSVLPALQNLPAAERAALEALEPVLLAPLITPRGRLSGVLVVGPPRSRRAYSTEDTQLLDSLGSEAALALDNARLYRDALRTRETLHAWLDSLPDAVLIVDGDGIIRFLNREGVERFELHTGQRSFLLRDSGPENGTPRRFGETIRGREYEIASAPLVGPDGHLSTVFVMRDVTQRKEERAQREQLEARARLASHLASIGEMASGIAHEINNPLTAVIGYSELLDTQALPEEAREIVGLILQGANRVAAIVRRLLTFSRQQTAERAPVDLNELIRSTLALRAYALETGNVRVTTRLDSNLPPTVADGQQLQQVFLNLIVNAEHAMRGAGGGELTLTSSREGDCVVVRIRDDGPGIPPEIQTRIFDPFFTTRAVGEGTGLGLSICHGIVSEHGGSLSVRSQPGEGAEFLVRLPIVEAEAVEQTPERDSEAGVPRRTRVRLLVVDDEPSVRTLLRRILEEAGHQVDTAANGREALERIATERYGLILMDVRMPGLNGMEVFDEMAKISGSITGRIVLLTGDVMAADTQAFISRTGAPVITKPFHAREVLELISRQLGDPA